MSQQEKSDMKSRLRCSVSYFVRYKSFIPNANGWLFLDNDLVVLYTKSESITCDGTRDFMSHHTCTIDKCTV